MYIYIYIYIYIGAVIEEEDESVHPIEMLETELNTNTMGSRTRTNTTNTTTQTPPDAFSMPNPPPIPAMENTAEIVMHSRNNTMTGSIYQFPLMAAMEGQLTQANVSGLSLVDDHVPRLQMQRMASATTVVSETATSMSDLSVLRRYKHDVVIGAATANANANANVNVNANANANANATTTVANSTFRENYPHKHCVKTHGENAAKFEAVILKKTVLTLIMVILTTIGMTVFVCTNYGFMLRLAVLSNATCLLLTHKQYNKYYTFCCPCIHHRFSVFLANRAEQRSQISK
ncbi:hypothetical protein RFI_38473 [Reticulomyxa filosa]|uniref:Uncharacterized protein n=1 Tax=Reticulomyxa filosa TaxID=46433 RepID=X6LE49_RETFI|nr:hypothetical protein RFI_38473 [Reticulomyxa filosa]|eukprot:ETN99014.1 hypothetical protein RFI_38473 [Reticulomyxa filosa]